MQYRKTLVPGTQRGAVLIVALVMLLASWLARRVESGSRVLATLGSLVLALIPAVLVLREVRPDGWVAVTPIPLTH